MGGMRNPLHSTACPVPPAYIQNLLASSYEGLPPAWWKTTATKRTGQPGDEGDVVKKTFTGSKGQVGDDEEERLMWYDTGVWGGLITEHCDIQAVRWGMVDLVEH